MLVGSTVWDRYMNFVYGKNEDVQLTTVFNFRQLIIINALHFGRQTETECVTGPTETRHEGSVSRGFPLDIFSLP